jgi:hypothetical protein
MKDKVQRQYGSRIAGEVTEVSKGAAKDASHKAVITVTSICTSAEPAGSQRSVVVRIPLAK